MPAPYAERSRNKFSTAPERRAAPRMKSYADVWADPGGMEAAIPCRIIDLSTTGAKIDAMGAALPDEFVLHAGAARHVARVVWRRQTLVGVEFQKGERMIPEGSRLGR